MIERAAREGWRATLCTVTAAAVLAGCTVASGPGLSYQNQPDLGRSFVRPQVPVPRAASEWVADKPTFVGLAVSGGGSRSANFGMAALTELDALGMLQHVDAISAVSGGSIPSAYFAVRGAEPDWAVEGRKVAATDFAAPLIGKLLNPFNLLATTWRNCSRRGCSAASASHSPSWGRAGRAGRRCTSTPPIPPTAAPASCSATRNSCGPPAPT
jgi:NTE family protein